MNGPPPTPAWPDGRRQEEIQSVQSRRSGGGFIINIIIMRAPMRPAWQQRSFSISDLDQLTSAEPNGIDAEIALSVGANWHISLRTGTTITLEVVEKGAHGLDDDDKWNVWLSPRWWLWFSGAHRSQHEHSFRLSQFRGSGGGVMIVASRKLERRHMSLPLAQ